MATTNVGTTCELGTRIDHSPAVADRDGTRLVVTEHGPVFDDLEYPAEREHGTGLLLDGLAASLKEQVAA